MLIESFNSGYICGALLGRGHVTADKTAAKYAMFLESKDKEFTELFGQRLDAFLENKAKRYERVKGNLNLYAVAFHKKSGIIEFCDKFRFKQGSFDWTVPQQCYEDKHFRKGFLQGFFDAKAQVKVRFRKKQKKTENTFRFDKVRHIRVSAVHRKGLNEIKTLLESFGIGSTISQSGINNILDIEGKHRVMMFKDKVGFGIQNKKTELDRALERSSGI
ncbi:MAG: LAGLIDADG family homing endonuclease [Candidatus Nanoarchaeia archaeon]|nr:LAGLIDADG family homing endonuclease [Candidatus Nanoarchaeia archaeon]MDD5239315.1 LAGLIDADG family homing endonuclease [Candidatus Nanoarchaeia archaeon]